MRRLLLASAALLAAAGAATYLAARSTRWQVAGELVWRGPADRPAVALTFDDGPWPEHLDEVLGALERAGARGTFFFTGEAMEAHRAEAARVRAAGHELGNHSWSHRRLVLRSEAFLRAEIERTDALLRDLGQAEPILFRPPYGKKLLGLPLYLARTRRTTVTWSLAADEDPSGGRDPAAMARHVVERASPGDIVLLHVLAPAREAERRALPPILEGLRRRGFRLVGASELLAGGR